MEWPKTFNELTGIKNPTIVVKKKKKRKEKRKKKSQLLVVPGKKEKGGGECTSWSSVTCIHFLKHYSLVGFVSYKYHYLPKYPEEMYHV